jgi:hypothetical protein
VRTCATSPVVTNTKAGPSAESSTLMLVPGTTSGHEGSSLDGVEGSVGVGDVVGGLAGELHAPTRRPARRRRRVTAPV